MPPKARRTFTCEQHWRFLAEFARWECAAGGPDPHMVLSGEMSQGFPLDERIWRAGCYIAVYNAPFAEAIWRNWSWEHFRKHATKADTWLVDNFSKIETRRERRCVRRPDWMYEYLVGYAKFARELPALIKKLDRSPEENFEQVWEAALTVPRLGRYVAIKLLEFYRRYCGADIRHPDIRPVGGRSPREMLGYLWPEHQAVVASDDDSPEVITLVNGLVKDTQRRLREELGVDLDMFKLQVMLCDYKQSWKGLRQYPGRSVDSEMAYAYEMERRWGFKSEIWPIRERIFPAEHLGEKQGWTTVRKDVAEVLGTYGYTWSDLLYDYKGTRALSAPKPRFRLPDRVVNSQGVTQIMPQRLYQSGNWLKYTDEQCRVRIKQFGLTGAVTMWRDDRRFQSLFEWYRHFPIPDGKDFSDHGLLELAEEVAYYVSTQGRVLVMCHAGRNRSGLLNALIVRETLGCSGEQALAYVRTARPEAVANPTFEKFLLSLNSKGSGLRSKVKSSDFPGYLFPPV